MRFSRADVNYARTKSLHFHMESVSFGLSGRGVGDAAALAKQKFVFVVGGVEYRCCRFQARFVSGLVRRLLASDRCLSRVSLKVCDDGAISRTL